MMYFHSRCLRFFHIMITQPQLLLMSLLGIIGAPFLMPLLMSLDLRQVHYFVGSFVQDYVLVLFFNDGLMLFPGIMPVPEALMPYLSLGLQVAVGLFFTVVLGILCYVYQVALTDMCKDALNNIPANLMRSLRHAFGRIKVVAFFVAVLWIVLAISWFLILFLGQKIFGVESFWETMPMILSFLFLVLYCKLLFSSCVLSNESLHLHSVFCRSSAIFMRHFSRLAVFLVVMAIVSHYLGFFTYTLFGAYAGCVFPVLYAPLFLYFVLYITNIYVNLVGTTQIFVTEERCIVSGR